MTFLVTRYEELSKQNSKPQIMKLQKNLSKILVIALTSTLLFFSGCKDDDQNIEIVPLTDIDGNVYTTVIIGDQEWMAENLKTTKYKNGTSIDLVTDNTAWENNTTSAFSWYGHDEAQYAQTFGALYNWQAVSTGMLCPDGWHVPSDEEWKILEMELGMSQAMANELNYRGTNEGSKLAGSAFLWIDGNLENNSEFGTSGFSALPGGYRAHNGLFNIVDEYGTWWTASEFDNLDAWYRGIYYQSTNVVRNFASKRSGNSVRCVRD